MRTPQIRTIEPIPVLFVRRTGPYYQAAADAFEALCAFAGSRGLLGPRDPANAQRASKGRAVS